MQISNNVLINVQDSDIKNGTFEIPNMIIGISDWAFQYSKKLEYIEIPENVQFLGHGIFDNCINLKKVKITKNITELPYSTFNGCDNLEIIEVSKDNKYYYSRNGIVYNKNITELVACPPQKDKVILPKTIKTIKRNALMGCSKIKQLKLPESLKNLEGCVFSRCTNLTKLEIPSSLINIDYFSFFCCNIKQIVLADERLKFNYSILENCSSLKTILIKGKDNKEIPVPNSHEVYEFLNNKNQSYRLKIIELTNNQAIKAGLSLYLFENQKLDNLSENITPFLYEYGKFVINNSDDSHLKNVLKTNFIQNFQYDSEMIVGLKNLKEYYTKQKTIELKMK